MKLVISVNVYTPVRSVIYIEKINSKLFFSLEKINKLMTKLGLSPYNINVISQNSVGKTTFMINTFLERKAKGLKTGFIVRNATKDYFKVMSWIEEHGTFRYKSDAFQILEKRSEVNYKIIRGKEKEKVVTVWVCVGYIVPLYYSSEAKGRKLWDADLWFQDEVALLDRTYLPDEKRKFMELTVAGGRINPNYTIITFSNNVDTECWIYSLTKNGTWINQEFKVFESQVVAGKCRVLWMYKPPKGFHEVNLKSIANLWSEDDPEFKKMSMNTRGSKKKADVYIVKVKDNEWQYNCDLNGIKFAIYRTNRYWVIGEYNNKMHPAWTRKITTDHIFYEKMRQHKSNGLLKWQNVQLFQELNKVLTNQWLNDALIKQAS